jgi:hypothetical protein
MGKKRPWEDLVMEKEDLSPARRPPGHQDAYLFGEVPTGLSFVALKTGDLRECRVHLCGRMRKIEVILVRRRR